MHYKAGIKVDTFAMTTPGQDNTDNSRNLGPTFKPIAELIAKAAPCKLATVPTARGATMRHYTHQYKQGPPSLLGRVSCWPLGSPVT